MRQHSTTKGLPIAEPRQIRALASTIRQDIVDMVTAIGPCSVSDMAAALGRPADGLYYHIRALLSVGLLAASGKARRGELMLDLPRKAMHLRYDPADRRNRTAIQRVIGAVLRSAERTFRSGFRPGVAVVSGARRNLWAGRSRGALSPDELAAVNQLIARLIDTMRSGRRDAGARNGRPRAFYEFSFVLAPSVRRAS